jgi:hypothetical protein
VHGALGGKRGRRFVRQLPANSTRFRFAQNSAAAKLHCRLTAIGIRTEGARAGLKHSFLRI